MHKPWYVVSGPRDDVPRFGIKVRLCGPPHRHPHALSCGHSHGPCAGQDDVVQPVHTCLFPSLHTCLSRVHTCLWRCPRSFLRVGLGAGEALGPFYFWLGPLDLSLGPFLFLAGTCLFLAGTSIFLAGNLDPLLPSFLDPRSSYVHTCILSLAIAVNIIFRSIISSILVVANIITTIIIIIVIIILSRFGF